jgi:predicted pyridoxine 5'-phosphate oxidase superfamily flavin-nucleotide-binding protein
MASNPRKTDFRFQIDTADAEFIDAAAARLRMDRGKLIRLAVEAYVDPLARLQEAVSAMDQMRADMLEMRNMATRTHDKITVTSDFIADLYNSEAAADLESED